MAAADTTREISTAMYLAGHGSRVKPRLIELQHQRILRYRRAFLRKHDISRVAPVPFVDLRLPSFGKGHVDLNDVPAFRTLYEEVQNHRYGIVFIDVDEVEEGLTPDYESVFIRDMLERSGAIVFNAFTDDGDVFLEELKERCGAKAREYEVTDASDIVNFFPALTSEIVETALQKELHVPMERQSDELQKISDRIEALGRLRPYSGGGTPFVEPRLSMEWQRNAKSS